MRDTGYSWKKAVLFKSFRTQDNLLGEEFVVQISCLLQALATPTTAIALDGRIIAHATHRTAPSVEKKDKTLRPFIDN